jgi:hypothetical protein
MTMFATHPSNNNIAEVVRRKNNQRPATSTDLAKRPASRN